MAGGKVQYAGAIDCFRQVVREGGVRALYRGLPSNLVGVIPEKALKLAVCSDAKKQVQIHHVGQRLCERRTCGVGAHTSWW